MENYKRLEKHKKLDEVENILKILNNYITDPAENEKYSSNQPIIFIVGSPRSGTTLMSQFLANYTNFCYPSNFISRFYYAPKIGALLQKLMFDLDNRQELCASIKNEIPFNSDLGKTKNALSPNEFWYYWRRFFQFSDEKQQFTTEDYKLANFSGFENGLRSIQDIYKTPIFLKGLMLNWHIELIHKHISNSFFIFTERDLADNAQSILEARLNYFGNTNEWFSFKPEEYDDIKNLSPEEQVVAQVFYTNKAIKNELKKIPNSNYIHVPYKNFCTNPVSILQTIINKANIEQTFPTPPNIQYTFRTKTNTSSITRHAMLYETSKLD
ncbi:MAG: sulfotransferase [Chitinophagales bacterium]|nr:sulfotransferase [Chitinophagales bacterium]